MDTQTEIPQGRTKKEIQHREKFIKDFYANWNATIHAEFLPNTRGKLASLIGKRTGYEFLVQRPNHAYREQPFSLNLCFRETDQKL